MSLSAGSTEVFGNAWVSDRCAAGFTLIELMVTLVVVAILATLAVPSFITLIQSNHLTTAANDLILNLNFARSAAGRQGRDIHVCATAACAVCADEACNTVLYQGVPALRDARLQSRAVQPLVFGYLGVAHLASSSSPYTGLVADLYTTRIASNNHRCIYLAAGSALSTCTDSADCATGAPNASCR